MRLSAARNTLQLKLSGGFGGRAVLEIVAPHQGDAYRAVYTVHFEEAVYVLHAFQKKSRKGAATPLKEIELIKRRLVAAEQDHDERCKGYEEEQQDSSHRG